jgi:VCBS repeat protein/FG-GAP repeat protein
MKVSRCAIVLCAILLACSAAFARGKRITFAAPVEYAVGNKPHDVAIGDLNGDGHLDVIVSNITDQNIMVLLGNGDGTFQSPVAYSLGNLGTSWPTGVAVGGFNSDGKLDVAVVTASNGLSGANALILFGNGDGTLQAPISSPTGTSPVSVSVGDVNGDGKLDLLVGGNGSAAVLLGNADGTFQNPQLLPVPFSLSLPVTAEWVIRAADLNGDGHMDLFTANWGNFDASIAVYISNGDGTFQSPVAYDLLLSGVPGATSVVAADFNGDGKLDLLVNSYVSDGMSIFIGNGDGTFQPAMPLYAGTSPNQLVVADFNRDRRLDIAAADFNDTSFNPTPAGFGVTVLGGGHRAGTFDALFQFDPGTQSSAIAAGDFNGDGLPDLVTIHPLTNNMSVLINTSQHVHK